VGEGLTAAAPILRSSLLPFGRSEQKSSSLLPLERATASRSSVFCCSAGPPIVWGCSYLRRRNQGSVCNGTLKAGLFVHCGCRGLNMYVFFGAEPCFFLISSTKTRLSAI
jgi:hypothetical protein